MKRETVLCTFIDLVYGDSIYTMSRYTFRLWSIFSNREEPLSLFFFNYIGFIIMTMKPVPEGKVIAPSNYTPAMIEVIKGYAPVNYEKAKIIGGLIGRSAKSVVSKCKSEGIEYVSKPAPAKKPTTLTKAETVALIEAEANCKLDGLSVAPVTVLNKLLTLFRVASSAKAEAEAEAEADMACDSETVAT